MPNQSEKVIPEGFFLWTLCFFAAGGLGGDFISQL
jgi:hypothetical protein